MKKTLSLFLILLLTFYSGIVIKAENESKKEAENSNVDLNIEAQSAILMDAATGKILFSQNENSKAAPASVTKIMTLLLVMEALENGKIELDDVVSVSKHASSMGGSQVFLEEGEKMSVEDLIKCTVIASANDAAVALAEYVFGSEKAFVAEMNKKAKELEMTNTTFENTTGLDDTATNHLTTAKDIAIMSCALIKYDIITKYSSLWQDTIRNGEFTLTNTNRLVRFYDGCNGLKTGSTAKAGYCMSATAKRDGLQLIAVIMGAETRDIRNREAKALLDYGFSNYALYSFNEYAIDSLPVIGGTKENIKVDIQPFTTVVQKEHIKQVEFCFDVPEKIDAPIEVGNVVGTVVFKIGNDEIGRVSVIAGEKVEKIDYLCILGKLFECIFRG